MAHKMQHAVFSFDHDMELDVDLTPKKMKPGERDIQPKCEMREAHRMFANCHMCQANSIGVNGYCVC